MSYYVTNRIAHYRTSGAIGDANDIRCYVEIGGITRSKGQQIGNIDIGTRIHVYSRCRVINGQIRYRIRRAGNGPEITGILIGCAIEHVSGTRVEIAIIGLNGSHQA